MPPKTKADLKKLENERLTALVMELLQEDENKYCADCEAKQPRWASWNLGVFLVHPMRRPAPKFGRPHLEGKVVQSMRVMGNAKAKAVYEAELPDNSRRPQTDQALEHFIRAKYDAKRYILKGWTPPVVDVKDLPPLHEPAAAKPAAKKMQLPDASAAAAQQKSSAQAEAAKKRETTLVDLFSTDEPAKTTNSASSAPHDLFGQAESVKSPTSDNLDDLFGSMVSAPSIPPSQSHPANINTHAANNVDSLSSGLESLDFGNSKKAMNNDDIMALYNTPSNVNAGAMGMQQPAAQFQNFNRNPQPFGGVPTAQAGFPQMNQSTFASYNAPSFTPAQWPNDSMTTSAPAFGDLSAFHSTPANNQQPPPPQQQPKKVASTAFDDLFAVASAQFAANPAPAAPPSTNNHAPTNFGNTPAAPPPAVSSAQQDLESLFM
ncbi:Stromal membrane-associated protein 2 [Aphelenchoides fujianensis]|nr:Stromal membrane-associated protein 2 [Aphelenchoides fujianensis]